MSLGASFQDQPKVSIVPRQTDTRNARLAATLRLDVRMVLVAVSASDAQDHPVHTLTRDRFKILEDGVEQKINSFSFDEGPVSMGLLFDSSGSMKNRIDTSIESLRLLFRTTTQGDEFFLVEFSDKAQLLSPFTPDPAEIDRQLGTIRSKGWTALLDALAVGSNQMRSARNRRRVLLVLSDGNDNNSRFSEAEVRNMVIEGNLQLYGIGLLHRPKLLQNLAEQTGGRVLLAQNTKELPEVVERLSREIRSQYVLGYSSDRPSDGKYHKLTVQLVPEAGAPPVRLAWRRGYYAPGE